MAGTLSGGLGREDEVPTHLSSLSWVDPPVESSDDTPAFTFTIHSKLVTSSQIHRPELCADGTHSASASSIETKEALDDSESTQGSTNRELRPLKRRRRGSEAEQNEPPDWPIFRHRNTDDDSPLKFACPFFKRDTGNYDDCFRYRLKRIADVKQHLKRHHRQRTHCNICLEQLPNEDALHDHVRAQSCRKREYIAPDGMTALQEKRIVSRVGTKNKSASEQWFEVYEILFPGEPRPQSAYLGDRLSEDIEVLRQFMSQRGSVMIIRELQRGNFQWGSGQEPERKLQNALSNVLDEFLSRQNAARNEVDGGRNSRPETTSQQRKGSSSQRTLSESIEEAKTSGTGR